MSQSSGRTFWERSQTGWHVALYLVLSLVALLIVTSDDLDPVRLGISLLLVLVVGILYGVAGRAALGTERLPLALGYLVPAWASCAILAQISGQGYLLLLVLIPQTWAMLDTRGAVIVNLVGIGGLLALRLISGESVGDVAVMGAVNLGLALLLGLWISGIVRESDRRAALIAELERTRAELATAERARGVLAERERLATEIHDTLAQGFTSIVALAQAAEVAVDRDAAAAREQVQLIERTARDNLAEARLLVAALGPADLQAAPLPQAVRRLAERFERETGLEAEVAVEGDPRPLQTDAEVVLLRAAQEALSNVRRHAAARSVTVRLTYDAEGATVEVHDDGRGFDPLDVEGYGLRGMKARVTQVGGDLAVLSRLGAGTTIRVRVP